MRKQRGQRQTSLAGLNEDNIWVGRLPTEVELYILSKLDLKSRCVAAQVCSHWKNLAYDRSLWCPINLSTLAQKENLSQALSQIILRTCDSVQEIDLSYCETNLDVEALAHLQLCTSLKVLSLAWCRQVTSPIVEAISTHCKELRVLDIRDCFRLVDSDLFHLAKLTELEELRMDYCSFGLRAILDFMKLSPNLKRISVFWLRKPRRPSCWNGDRFREICQNDADREACAKIEFMNYKWVPEYIGSYDLKTPPKDQIEAAAAQAKRQNKLVLLCVSLCAERHLLDDWSIRLAYFLTFNPLIKQKLDETFIYLNLDEKIGRGEQAFDDFDDFDESENQMIKEGVVNDWCAFIRGVNEWPYLLVLDADAKLLMRQDTGPLETFARYDAQLMFTFIEGWHNYLQTGVFPQRITH
jgi:hypothetical protein